MKNFIGFVFLIALTLCAGNPAFGAAGFDRKFMDGLNAYQQQDYSLATEIFKEITDNGIVNGELFYNLGNAYFKSGDIGRAILWYERAKRYIPQDPDLTFNLNYVRSLVKDENAADTPAIYRVLFFGRELAGPGVIVWAAVVCNAIFWLFFIFQRIRPFRWLRVSAAVCIFFFLILFPSAIYNYYVAAYQKTGIVLQPEIEVRSGLSDQATALFSLHAGSRVHIQGEKKGFYRIFFSEGKIGWVAKDYIDVI